MKTLQQRKRGQEKLCMRAKGGMHGKGWHTLLLLARLVNLLRSVVRRAFLSSSFRWLGICLTV